MYVMGIWEHANFWNQSSVGNREDILEYHLSSGCLGWIGARWFDVYSFSNIDYYWHYIIN